MNTVPDPATVVAIFTAAVLAVIVVRLFYLRGRAGTSASPEDLPYRAAESALSPAERSFYGVLRQAVGTNYEIFAKVRLADVIHVKDGLSARRRYAAFGRISSKHVDFILCERGTFRIAGVIELDDSSHQRDDRRRRDEFVDSALAAAAIPVLHLPARRAYSAVEIREQVADRFENKAQKESRGAPTSAVDAPDSSSPGETRRVEDREPTAAPSFSGGPGTAPRRRAVDVKQSRGLVKLGAAALLVMLVALSLRSPTNERALQPVPNAATSERHLLPPISAPIQGGPSEPLSPSPTIASSVRPNRDTGRVIGYREERVPGKPLEQCIGPDNELNEAVRRCREGYTQRVPVYR